MDMTYRVIVDFECATEATAKLAISKVAATSGVTLNRREIREVETLTWSDGKKEQRVVREVP